MQPSQFLQADYLDIVFDNRNKNYGGYELRKHYTARAYKALGTTLFAISALVAVVLLTSGSAEVLLQPIQKTNVLAHLDNTVVIPPPAIKPPAIPKPAPANTTGPIHITVDNKVLPDDPKPDVTAALNTTGAAGGGRHYNNR